MARGFTGTQIFSTVGSTKEQGEPNHCGIIGGASQWFAYQAPTNGTLVITTDGSNFDTVLAVYTGSSLGTLQQVACNDDANATTKQSQVSFTATAGVTYYVQVASFRPSITVMATTGILVLSAGSGPPPAAIALSPTTGRFMLGGRPTEARLLFNDREL